MGALPLLLLPKPARAALIASLQKEIGHADSPHGASATWCEARAKPLPLGFGPLDARLPDVGLPRGAVVEISAPNGLGHSTRLALGACASAQAREQAWCAWIDASHSLYAPGIRAAGVELERLLVVRPGAESLARAAVRVAQSGLFAVVVVERTGVPGAPVLGERPVPRSPNAVAGRTRWDTVVRRLALAVEGSETVVLLLSRPSAESLPVAMRLELGCPRRDTLALCIAKERHGRLGGPYLLSLASLDAESPPPSGEDAAQAMAARETLEPPWRGHERDVRAGETG